MVLLVELGGFFLTWADQSSISLGPSNGILSGQQFVNDYIAVVTLWLQVLDKISLGRSSVHWFSIDARLPRGVMIV
jgi:hypothetical protein